MLYTLVHRRFPSGLLKKLIRLARRNRCSVSEQARAVLEAQLDKEQQRERRLRALLGRA